MKMSTTMRSSGTTSSMQKPHMIHLLRFAARDRRRSWALGGKGFTDNDVEMAAASLMSGFAPFFHSLDDDVRGHIDAARDDEQHDAQDEEHAVVFIAIDGLSHFRGDGGGHRAHRIRKRLGNAVA